VFKFSAVNHLFFEDVGNACDFNELDLCAVADCLEYGEVQSFGGVAEDGLMASHEQHRTAGHSTCAYYSADSTTPLTHQLV